MKKIVLTGALSIVFFTSCVKEWVSKEQDQQVYNLMEGEWKVARVKITGTIDSTGGLQDKLIGGSTRNFIKKPASSSMSLWGKSAQLSLTAMHFDKNHKEVAISATHQETDDLELIKWIQGNWKIATLEKDVKVVLEQNGNLIELKK